MLIIFYLRMLTSYVLTCVYIVSNITDYSTVMNMIMPSLCRHFALFVHLSVALFVNNTGEHFVLM